MSKLRNILAEEGITKKAKSQYNALEEVSYDLGDAVAKIEEWISWDEGEDRDIKSAKQAVAFIEKANDMLDRT
jgi:hypothetical protein